MLRNGGKKNDDPMKQKKGLLVMWLLLLTASGFSQKTDMVMIPDGNFVPFINGQTTSIKVQSFWMDENPVTNSEFIAFVKANPQWKPENVKSIFADEDYLSHWKDTTQKSHNISGVQFPVVNVSWFAANAYCKSVGKRLPTMYEWEYAGASLPEGSNDNKILNELITRWYSRQNDGLSNVRSIYRNQFGVWDMYGQIWEWVYDFNSISSNEDSRNKEEIPEGFFCGSAALNASDASDYVTFIRYAFRSSLKGEYTVRKLGFRCAKNVERED